MFHPPYYYRYKFGVSHFYNVLFVNVRCLHQWTVGMIAYIQQSLGYGTVLFGVLNKTWKFFVKFKISLLERHDFPMRIIFDFNKRGSALKLFGTICKQDEIEHRGSTHKIIE